MIWNTGKAPERKTQEVTPLKKCQVGTPVGSPGECPDQRHQGGEAPASGFPLESGHGCGVQGEQEARREHCPELSLQELSLPFAGHTEDEPTEIWASRSEGQAVPLKPRADRRLRRRESQMKPEKGPKDLMIQRSGWGSKQKVETTLEWAQGQVSKEKFRRHVCFVLGFGQLYLGN